MSLKHMVIIGKLKRILKKVKFTNYKTGVQNTVKWYKKNKSILMFT